ncbi:MAG: hypothetical protein R6W66_07230 [Pelovirga sp.]
MYQHIWDDTILTVLFTGSTSGAEIKRSVIEAQNDARFAAIRYKIVHLHSCHLVHTDEETTREIARLHYAAAPKNPHLQIAVITSNPAVIEFVFDYINLNISKYPLSIFSSYHEVNQWMERKKSIHGTPSCADRCANGS